MRCVYGARVAAVALSASAAGCLATPPGSGTTDLDGAARADQDSAVPDGTLSEAAPLDGTTIDAADADANLGDASDASEGGCSVTRSSVVLNDAVQVVGGGYYTKGGIGHACALRADGTVVCWGDNSLGQLGVPQSITLGTSRPVAVQFPADAGSLSFRRLISGVNTMYAIDEHLRLWAWGENTAGQLGNGSQDTFAHPEPALVDYPGDAGDPLLATDLAAGWQAACALDSTGALYCWGSANANLLGPVYASGGWVDVDASSLVPQPRTFAGSGPGLLGGGSGLAAQFCDANHFSAVCWGRQGGFATEFDPNDGGVLTQDFTFKAADLMRDAGATFPIRQIVFGAGVGCLIDNLNGLYCSGGFPKNISGTAVPAAVPFDGGFSQIAMGDYHLCGVSAQDGTVYCGGANNFGELGNPVIDSGLAMGLGPVVLSDGGLLSGATSVGAGLQFSCAIEQGPCGPGGGGPVLCWGNNASGELGADSGVRISPTPLAVSAPAP